jgi:hypothetical protein
MASMSKGKIRAGGLREAFAQSMTGIAAKFSAIPNSDGDPDSDPDHSRPSSRHEFHVQK